MRTINTSLVEEYADQIRPLLPLASRAFGTQKAGSPARNASDKVNSLLYDYGKAGGNLTHLAEALDGDISLPGLRRRHRAAKATHGAGLTRPISRTGRGSRDPELVKTAAEKISLARVTGGPEYGQAVRDAYEDGVALQAVARELGISYFSIWTAATSAA